MDVAKKLIGFQSIRFSSSRSSPAQSLNVSMCSDVHDVEDGELDEVEVAEQERGDEAEGDDDDAAMASPGGAKVSDQGWENSLSISITKDKGKSRSLGTAGFLVLMLEGNANCFKIALGCKCLSCHGICNMEQLERAQQS